MIVCVCRRVCDLAIARPALAGLEVDAIEVERGVARPCGRCTPAAALPADARPLTA